MNKKQKLYLWIVVVIVLMGIFPPARPGMPPRPLIGGKPPHYIFLLSTKASDIALNRLIIQWGIAGAITFGLFYIFRDKNPKGQQKELKYPEE